MTFEPEIQKCLEVLRAGGTLLYPTDTIWGIGCDATNEQAVEKIFAIKQRETSQSLICLVSDIAMLNRYVKDVPAQAWDILEAVQGEVEDEASSPVTIIYDEGRGFAKNVPAGDKSIALRLVQDTFCQRLIHKFGKPVVSTSANLSGEPAPLSFSEISREIKNRVDYVVNWRQQEHMNASPSSILRLKANGEVQIIRR